MSIKNWILTGTGSLLLLPAVTGMTAQAAGLAVASLDMAKVLRNYSEVKVAVSQIKEKKDEYQKQIDALQDDIKQINGDIQTDKEKGKDTKEKEASKRKKIFDLQQKYQALRDKLDKMEAEEFDQIKDRIRVEVERLAKSKGIDLVIEKQWLYHGAALDLTEDVLASLGSGAASAPAKGKRSTPKAQQEE